MDKVKVFENIDGHAGSLVCIDRLGEEVSRLDDKNREIDAHLTQAFKQLCNLTLRDQQLTLYINSLEKTISDQALENEKRFKQLITFIVIILTINIFNVFIH